jgi:hypothetical protein
MINHFQMMLSARQLFVYKTNKVMFLSIKNFKLSEEGSKCLDVRKKNSNPAGENVY